MIGFEGPLVILAPGLSFNTAACAMFSGHPALYGLLETQLFARAGMSDWLGDFGTGVLSHGLLRTVAQLQFGEQSPRSVKYAKRWTLNRGDVSTASVFGDLVGIVQPRIVIECSALNAYQTASMRRILESFPDARFVHLTRHPVAYGDALLQLFRSQVAGKNYARARALLGNPESVLYGLFDEHTDDARPDPLRLWRARHSAILAFTDTLTSDQCRRVRVEDLFTRPSTTLQTVTSWLGIRSDHGAIEPMLHPERWEFACLGPWNARLGGDVSFLRAPGIPALELLSSALDQTVPWSEDALPLSHGVQELARLFGYC
jgi:hypothetical protein